MSNTETSKGENAAPSAIPLPPPPPPPMPGTAGAINLPTYKETKEKNDAAKAANNSMEQTQYANLPDKLMSTMKREKKPFTYTPLSVGDNGKLDLSQIKSPKMKKRLMANMKDEEEQDENKIESIDSSIQNNKNQDKLNQELSVPTPIQLKSTATNQPSSYFDTEFTPSVQTKPSLVVPLSVLNENNDYLNQNNQTPLPPLRQASYDLNRPLSPAEKLDQLLNEQLKRDYQTDLNNNYSSSYDQNNNLPFTPKQYYGNVKPKKVNIAQELSNERNFNCVPSSQNHFNDYNLTNNYNQSPKLWSSNTTSTTTPTSYPIKIEVQNDKPQYYSNPQLNYQTNYSPNNNNYERSQSQQGSYQIPIINQNITNQTTSNQNKPIPPQRQQSLNRTNLQSNEKEIPIQYEEPIQSKSFKILQRLTAGIEDEIEKLKVLDQQNKLYQQQYRDPLEDKLPAYYGTLNHIEQPRIRSERRIPIQVENNNSNFNTFTQPEYHSSNEQNWIYQNNYQYSSPSSINSTTSTNQSSFWTQPEWIQPQIPASRQPQIRTPNRYAGENVPSPSFRILQLLANENDW